MPDSKRRLILEVELPEIYVDDLPEIIRDHGSPESSMSDEILTCIGEIGHGLLIVEVSGEKDSEIVTVPALVRAACIEDEAPTSREERGDSIEGLVWKVDPDEEGRLPNLWRGA